MWGAHTHSDLHSQAERTVQKWQLLGVFMLASYSHNSHHLQKRLQNLAFCPQLSSMESMKLGLHTELL